MIKTKLVLERKSITVDCFSRVEVSFWVDAGNDELKELRKINEAIHDVEEKMYEEISKTFNLGEWESIEYDVDGKLYVVRGDCRKECYEVRPLSEGEAKLYKQIRTKYNEELAKLANKKEEIIKKVLEDLSKKIPNTITLGV